METKKINLTCFITLFALLQWSRTKLTISPNYACMSLRNMSLWHKDFSELIILRNSRQTRSSEDRARFPFLRDIYIYKGNLICKDVSLSVSGREQ